MPRKNELAYIKAKVINESQYALLAGPANIFLDNNFVSKVTDLINLISDSAIIEFLLI